MKIITIFWLEQWQAPQKVDFIWLIVTYVAIDFCYKFIKDKESLESNWKLQRVDGTNVKNLEKEMVNFSTKLTRVDLEVTEGKLFREASSIFSHDLKLLLAYTTSNATQELLEFLGRQGEIRERGSNGLKQINSGYQQSNGEWVNSTNGRDNIKWK